MGKIQYSMQPQLNDEFINEFEAAWTDAQFNLLTSGFKGVQPDPATLPDASNVDPRTDPVTARSILLNPKSVFRIGEQPFVLPLLAYLEAAEQKVPPEVKALRENQSFYLIKYGIDVKPENKEKFVKVLLHLEYPAKQGFLTFSMLPDTEVEQNFGAQAKITVGVDPHLKFRVPDVNLQPGLSVGGGIQAATDASFLLNLSYHPLQAKLVALGEKSSYVEWHIENPARLLGSVEFSTIVSVPKGTKSLPLNVKGHYTLERGILWWQKETRIDFRTDDPILLTLS